VTGPTAFTFPYDIFCNVDKIHLVKCPVFIIHGVKDAVVPFEHGTRLFDMVKTKKTYWWIENAGHNNIEHNWGSEFLIRIKNFLDNDY